MSEENILARAGRLMEEAKSEDLRMEQIKQEFAKGGVTVQQEKSNYLKLKYVLLESEARFAFLQKMILGDQQLQHNDEDQQSEDIYAQLTSSKEEKDSIREEISDSIEQSLEASAKLQSKTQELDKLVEELKQAKDKLESMKEKMVKSQSTVKEHIQTQKIELSRLNDLLKKTHTSLESAKQEKDGIKISNEKLRQDCNISNGASHTILSESSGVERALEKINKLDGITLDVHHRDKSSVIIEFINTQEQQTLPSLFVNIQLSRQQDDRMHIKSATVNLDCFSVDDLVEAERHSVPSFIRKVHQRWQGIKQQQT